MNKEEASIVLQREFNKFKGLIWTEALAYIGKESVEKVKSPSGVEYLFEILVSYVDERELDVEVEGVVYEANGRRLFPPLVQQSYCIENPLQKGRG